MALDIDASALLVYRAAWTRDSGAPRVTREAAMAKMYATEAAQSGTGPFDPVVSDFMQYTSRIAGYIPISKRGMALALSFRWGLNSQLIKGSHTYPDRLFFMGGVDTMRAMGNHCPRNTRKDAK